MNITSRQLKAFLLTAKHQSFSRAAEQLFITQSGISVLIRKLENQLGFRLFERTTRRVSLTEFGTKFLPIAHRNLLDLDGAAATIGRSASAANRRLAVGANPLFAKMVLPTVINEYAKFDPQLKVILCDGYRNDLIDAINAGEIDLALGVFRHPVSGMRRSLLHRFTLMLILPLTEVPRLARSPRWEDLVDCRLLGSPDDHPVQQLINQQLRRVGRTKPPEMRFHYFDTHIAMVEAGAGVAVLPSFCFSACRERKLAMYPLTDPVVPVDFYQVTRRDHTLPPGADGFTRFLQGYIAEWAKAWPPMNVPSG